MHRSQIPSLRKLKISRALIRIIQLTLLWFTKIFFGKVDASSYSVIIPETFYSPWLADRSFREVYAQVRDYTFVGEYKCYGLWKLVEQVKHLNGDMIEVGVWRGGSGCLIAQKVKLERIPATVYLCDTFQGVVKAGNRDSVYRGGELADVTPEIVGGLMRKMALDHVKVLQGVFPDETGEQVRNCSFRLCHIDVDVYQSAKDIVEWIWGRMPIGGIIVFDDYGGRVTDGVTALVNEEGEKADRILIHNLSGHGILVKVQ